MSNIIILDTRSNFQKAVDDARQLDEPAKSQKLLELTKEDPGLATISDIVEYANDNDLRVEILRIFLQYEVGHSTLTIARTALERLGRNQFNIEEIKTMLENHFRNFNNGFFRHLISDLIKLLPEEEKAPYQERLAEKIREFNLNQ